MFCSKECCKLKALTPKWRHNIECYRFNYNRLIHVFVVQFDINKYSYSTSKQEWNLIFLGLSRIQALISKNVLFKLVLKTINLQWPLFWQAHSLSPYIGTNSLLCVFMRLMLWVSTSIIKKLKHISCICLSVAQSACKTAIKITQLSMIHVQEIRVSNFDPSTGNPSKQTLKCYF